jgi:hypothetical protein
MELSGVLSNPELAAFLAGWPSDGSTNTSVGETADA